MVKEMSSSKIKRILVFLFLIIGFLIIAGGYLFYKLERNSIQNQKFEELSEITKLKINQILLWKRERIYDGEYFASNDIFIEKASKLLFKHNKNSISDYFSKRLSSIKKDGGYDNIYLITNKGQILFSLTKGISGKNVDPLTTKGIDSAINYNKIVFSDFHFAANNKTIHLNIIAPIINPKKNFFAALIFNINPNNYLYPIIQQTTIQSKSLQSLIVERKGDSVLFLTNLRYQKNTALRFSLPLKNINHPAVKAVMGYQGPYKGLDHHNINVLTDIRPIPGTPWFMITKIDQAEVFSASNSYLIFLVVLILILLFALGAGLAWYYHSRQKNIYFQLYKKEKDLRESQEEFKTTLYSIGDAVITTDNSRRVNRMNNVAEKLTGWKETEAQGQLLENIFDIINENTGLKADNTVEQVLTKGVITPLANNTLLITKELKRIPITGSGAPINERENIVTGVVFVFSDKSEERKAQNALAESEKEFRNTFEFASIGKAIVSLDGTFLKVNNAFIKMIGYSLDEILKLNFNDITHPDEIKVSRESMQRLITGEINTDRFEKRYIRKDGKVIWVDLNVILSKDSAGKPNHFIAHFVDITERKQKEIEVKTILKTTIDGFYTVDENGKILEVNDSYCSMIGYSQDELLKMGIKDIEVIDTEEIIKERIQHIFKYGYAHFETKHRRKDGRIIDIEASVNFLVEDKLKLFCFMRDTTDRKTKEAELLKSEEKFSKAFNKAPLLFSLTDMETGEFIEVNETSVNISGFSREELIGKKSEDLGWIDHSDRQKLLNALKKDGEINGVELNLHAKNNRQVIVLYYSTIIQIDGNNIILSISQDITEYKRTQAALMQSEERFKQIYNNSLEAILYTNPDGGEIYSANPAACSILGMSENEIISRGRDNVINMNDIQLPAAFKLRKETGKYEGQLNLIKKSGEIFPAYVSTSIFNDNEGVRRSIILFHDITEQKKTEQNLIQSEEKYSRLVENSPEGIGIYRDGKIFYMNPMGIKLLKANSIEDILGKPVLNFVHPDYIDIVKDRMLNMKLNEKPVETLEEKFLRIDGTSFDVAVTAIPIIFGGISATSVIFRDITERKESQNQIEKSLREKEILLKEIHHRVKNNFQKIISLISLQAEMIEDVKILRAFEDLQSRLISMSIIHELMYGTGDFEGVDAKDYVGRLTGFLMQTYSTTSRIKLNLDIDNFSIDIESITPCGLIINEIISNSLKYAFPGNVEGNINVLFKKSNDEYNLVVSDDGIGIKEKIDFESHKSLGLRLIEMLTRQLKGKLEVNQQEKGLRFSIKFKVSG